jgi:hypothetical protein
MDKQELSASTPKVQISIHGFLESMEVIFIASSTQFIFPAAVRWLIQVSQEAYSPCTSSIQFEKRSDSIHRLTTQALRRAPSVPYPRGKASDPGRDCRRFLDRDGPLPCQPHED